MVYTQARLDHAILVFREAEEYLKKQKLNSSYLQDHLYRKYELRKPPPVAAFTARVGLWTDKGADDDEDYDPSSSKNKKRASAKDKDEPKTPKGKRKRADCGSANFSNTSKKRDAKGITWAQGRRQGRSQILKFKFSKPEITQALKALAGLHGHGACADPRIEVVNVFREDGMDAEGFLAPSQEKREERRIEKDEEREEQEQSVWRQSGGRFDSTESFGFKVKNRLSAPRGSVESSCSLSNPRSLFGSTEQASRKRALPMVSLPSTSKKGKACEACKETKTKCSLTSWHRDFKGPCAECDQDGRACWVDGEPSPRLNPNQQALNKDEAQNKNRSFVDMGLMGNTPDTAIDLDSENDIPWPTVLPTPSKTFITTNWAHPISFTHRPYATKPPLPCHFCTDYRYGIFGCGTLSNVEVALDPSKKWRVYTEISGGHVSSGKESTRMCCMCALERLRTSFCGHGCGADEKRSGHELMPIPGWREKWAKEKLSMDKVMDDIFDGPKMSPGQTERRAKHAPCSLCLRPAFWRCVARQRWDEHIVPVKEGEKLQRRGCCLLLCGRCKEVVQSGKWGREGMARALGREARADLEFLFRGSLLHEAWGGYMGRISGDGGEVGPEVDAEVQEGQGDAGW